jgi:hypothetical protein
MISLPMPRWAYLPGDGFADGFPIDALVATLRARTERPQLSKADWVAFANFVRP